LAASRPIPTLSNAALQTVRHPRATTEKALGQATGAITTGLRAAASALGWVAGKARRVGGRTAAPGLSVVQGGSSARPRARGNGKPTSTTPAGRAPRKRTTKAMPSTTTKRTTTKRTTTQRADASKSATKRAASRTTTRPAASKTPTKPATAETDVAPVKKVAAKPGRGAQGPSAATIRQWAQEQGIEVSARGRVPRAVRDQYLAAH
jgi:hypothetical protein